MLLIASLFPPFCGENKEANLYIKEFSACFFFSARFFLKDKVKTEKREKYIYFPCFPNSREADKLYSVV